MTTRLPVILLLSAMPFMLASCSRAPDEEAIRAAFDEMVQAVEEKQPKAALAHVSSTFRGPDGLDRDGARRLMMAQFLRNQNIKVFVSGLQVVVRGERATSTFSATLTGADRLMPERVQRYTVEFEWWRDKDGWSLVAAAWEPTL